MVVEGEEPTEQIVPSKGTVIRQGIQSDISPTIPQVIGYYSENWINFNNEIMWLPITDEEYEKLPMDKEEILLDIKKKMLDTIYKHASTKNSYGNLNFKKIV